MNDAVPLQISALGFAIVGLFSLGERNRTVLSWLGPLYVDCRRRWRHQTGAESGAATRPEGDSDGADDTDRSVGATAAGETNSGAAARERDASGSWRGLLGGEEVSKLEVRIELGLQPHEFLAWLVRDAGGRMWQADMVEATGWSKSTVSRYLDSLESDDIVERVQVGRRKLVGTPGELPSVVPTSDSRTSSWSPEGTNVSDA